MTQLNILELAKHRDINAINILVREWLNLPSITTTTSLKQDCLQVMLESVQVPEQHSVVPLIRDGMIDLLPSRPKITYLINRVLRSRSRRLDAKDTKKEEKENR